VFITLETQHILHQVNNRLHCNATNYRITLLLFHYLQYFHEMNDDSIASLSIFTYETTEQISIRLVVHDLHLKLSGKFNYNFCRTKVITWNSKRHSRFDQKKLRIIQRFDKHCSCHLQGEFNIQRGSPPKSKLHIEVQPLKPWDKRFWEDLERN
jgi:hypothetical protein